MNTSSDYALFIISTPFQALCAVEALHYYNINLDHADFVIINGKSATVNSQSEIILNLNNIYSCKTIIYSSFRKLLLRSSIDIKEMSLNANYGFVFVGDFFNPLQKTFITSFITNRTKIIYLDDGSSSIKSLEWKNSYHKSRSINGLFKRAFIDLYFHKNKFKNVEYFTIFDKINSPFKININTFKNLRSKIVDKQPIGCYILGSSIYLIGIIQPDDYYKYLEKIISHARKKYPEQIIYYCPHRVEKDQHINQILKNFNLSLYKTKYTIEADMVLEENLPRAVYSFGSTASYSLKILFPEVSSHAVKLNFKNDKIRKIYTDIYKIYSKKGIVLI